MTHPTAASQEIAERNRFFGLLSIATLLPYVFFVFTAPQVVERPGIAQLTALVMFLGANAHVGSSFFFYLEPGIRRFMVGEGAARFVWLPPALVLTGAAVFALGSDAVRAYVVCAFWVWQVHHFTRQNHGLLAFASRAAGLTPSLAERTALTLTNVAGILGAFTFVAPYLQTPLFGWGWQIHAVGTGVYAAAFAAWAVSLTDPLRRQPGWRAWIMLLMMLFYLPLYLVDDAFLAVYVFLTAHGLQYLVFMGYVVRRSEARRGHALAGLAVTTFGAGLAIFAMQAADTTTAAGRAAVGAAFGVIVWHFLLDARIWRLSEPFQRRTMTERFDFVLAPGHPGAER